MSHDHGAGVSRARAPGSGTLEIWIEEEWLVPARAARELAFTEMDLARANLIRDLKEKMGVNDEGLGVILHLLDQMHGLRRALKDALKIARERQTPPPVDRARDLNHVTGGSKARAAPLRACGEGARLRQV